MRTIDDLISFDVGVLGERVVPVCLADGHREPMKKTVQEEFARYPDGMLDELPRMIVVDSFVMDGEARGASYIAEQRLGILAPRLDLRGNVHRLVAFDLLTRHSAEAARLRAALTDCSATQLYGGLLGVDGEIAALVGAIVSGRQTLVGATDQLPEFRTSVAHARTFLGEVGVSEQWLDDLPPSKPYAFLSTVGGTHPEFRLAPGNVRVTVTPPADRGDDSYQLLSESDAATAIRGLQRDVWILPESLAEDVLSTVYLIKDISTKGCDIAGLAVGADGQPSAIFVESSYRRTIFFHELAHAMHGRFNSLFPTSRWLTEVSGHDGYLGSGLDFIRRGIRLPDFAPELLRRGFITSYGSASLEEDVAELAGALFMGEERLWSCLPDAPRVDEKFRLLVDFLHQVDPVFTRQYFEALATTRRSTEAAWSRV